MHMSVCACAYVCKHLHVCMCVGAFVWVCVYVGMYMCVHAFMHASACVCVEHLTVFVHVGMWVCTFACMHAAAICHCAHTYTSGCEWVCGPLSVCEYVRITCTTSTANPVCVGVNVPGHIIVHHCTDVRDVQTSC